ncbi:MAG: hypothetical protein C0465_23135 [Ralstonia sp.]|nr:hypothetical protein [Ralstonia sp.]MBA9848785.1 hypothetical protein [Ralstonia pickettii]MXI26447.1 hypothetical protein [Escherichia coli]MBA4233488.1 hypothetical protein [Ralstonia sp.]MBA4238051.1 hypothetical protein [Ralstonia sp.]
MPLRERLFGASVARVVPTTNLVGITLATSSHTVETVLGTRLRDNAILSCRSRQAKRCERDSAST